MTGNLALALLLLVLNGMMSYIMPAQAEEATPEATTPAAPIDTQRSSLVDAYFTVENDTPRLGEPFIISWIIIAPPDVEINRWPEFPVESEPLEILEVGEIIQEMRDGQQIFSQELMAVLWQTGAYLTPEIVVEFRAGGTLISSPVQSVFLTVPSSLAGVENISLRPWSPPRGLPYTPSWLIIISVTAVVGIVGGLVLGVRSVIRRRPAVYSAAVKGILAELEDLRYQELSPVLVYPLVADKLRTYLQTRLGIDAVQMTTIELLNELQRRNAFNTEQRRALQRLLEQADLVKFARFEPDVSSSHSLINYALRWLEQVGREETLQKQEKENAHG